MATAAVQQPLSAPTHDPQTLEFSSVPSKNAPHDVKTVLHYLKPNADGSPPKPTIADRPETIPPLEAHPVTIHDVRGNEDAYTLDKNGFQFYKHTSKEKEFPSDEYVVSSGYFGEMEEFLKDTLGASRVFIFDHTIRRPPPENLAPGARVRGPVQRVHIDQSFHDAVSRVTEFLPKEAEKLLKGRVQLLNVWRPIKTIKRDPLAVADAHSVKDDCLIKTDLVHPERVWQTLSVKHDPGHRWYYKSELAPDEVFAFKAYDSKTDGRARRVPHTAFEIPGTEDVEHRESIEVRALVFHEDDTPE